MVLATAMLVASGCAQVGSNEVSPSAIYADYSASYTDSTAQLSFTATFSVAGSTGTSVMLDGTSSVSLDGVTMPGSSDIINQYIYDYAYTATPTELASPHEFVYTDNDGKTYANTVQIPLDVAVDTANGTVINVGNPFTVNWTSQDLLQSTDEVQVTIQKSDDSTSVVNDDFGTGDVSGQVVFQPSDLSPLGIGNFRVLVCRNQYLPIQEAAEAGGNISISRCLPEIAVTLEQ